jgi:hypothetical protein
MQSTQQPTSVRAFRARAAFVLFCGVFAACAAGRASAQDAGPPPWLDVAVAQVKGDRTGEFEDLMKDYLQARKAAGLPVGQVFQIVLGNGSEYHIVAPAQSVAAGMQAQPPMPEADWAQWVSRITDTVDSVKFFYASTYPQHGVMAPANSPTPTLILLRKITVAQGKEAEYEAWVADQYMPAFRQTGPLGHTMSRGVYGDSLQHYYHAYPLAGFADLDAPDPLIGVLGQRRYDQVFNALDGVVVDHEMVIGLIRSDLAE